MLNNQTVAVIGAGNIGRAFLGGLINGHEFNPEQIWATRRNATRLEQLADQFPGIRTTTNNVKAVQNASVIVLASKPQTINEVLEEIRDHVAPDALVISVLAGITTSVLEERLQKDIAVIRTMPNTPALIDAGATAITPGRFATEDHLALAQHMFEAVGLVEIITEDLMDAATGVAGSGPAYVYMFIEALTDGGVRQGLPRSTALRLAAQTVFGAARMAIETGKHPAVLRDEVTTPGGTTIAAIAELESHGLRTMLIDAVATASDRSKELRKIQE